MKQALGYSLLALATTAVVNAEQKPLSSDNPLPSGPEPRVKPQLPSDESLDGFVESLIDQLRVPGLSLAIVDGGEITSKVRTTINNPHLLLYAKVANAFARVMEWQFFPTPKLMGILATLVAALPRRSLQHTWP